MNLLLLLSALLSALSGAGGIGRPATSPVTVARSTQAVVAREARVAAVPGRPAVVPSSVADVVLFGSLPVWRLAAVAPLYASRRRE